MADIYGMLDELWHRVAKGFGKVQYIFGSQLSTDWLHVIIRDD